MHLQIKGSPGDTPSNVRLIVVALADADVNIKGIAPDFDPPHVRVAVNHAEEYDPDNGDDDFNRALNAMEAKGLAPVIRPAVTVAVPDKAGALRVVLNRIMREGYAAESILPLAGGSEVQFGVGQALLAGWADESDRLAALILADLERL